MKKNISIKIEETQAPSGYEKLAGPVYFKLISKPVDGTRKASLEILYGDLTPDALNAYLNITKDEKNAETDIIQIANRQKELPSGEEEKPVTKPTAKPTGKPVRKSGTKTGDQTNLPLYACC